MRRLLVLLCLLVSGCSADWWSTPDQRGQRAFRGGEFARAAEEFRDASWQGASLFRAKEFETAAAAFGRAASPEALYNRATALVYMGLYDDAITGFEQALELRPGWVLAEENLAIAKARKEALAPPEDDYGGTGGMLEADKIVFDDRAANSSSTTTEEGGEEPLSDAELRSLWLRRVETKPADFLRAKFAYQLARESFEEEEQE